MKFESFDEDYVRRLTDGDPDAGEHFAAYFERVLFLKLRVRLRSVQLIEDIQQETLLRVLSILRRDGGVNRPERFGAFVSGVCENVMRELRRIDERDDSWEEQDVDEPTDPKVDLDAALISAEAKEVIRRVFAVLPDKDRRILQAIYLDGIPKADVCRMFNVNADYLRVLIHRARRQFRNAYRGGRQDGHGEIAN